VESLDDVIDAMIADRVIHRHRRKWLIVIALVVVLALVILATGGWKEKKGRSVPTLTAPVTVTAGRFEYNFTKAEIVVTPKGEYTDAEAVVQVYFDLKNIDEEEHKSDSVSNALLRMVPGDGSELIQSNGSNCRGDSNWKVVYGLPPESCLTKFKVPADFQATEIEVGVLGEKYESDSGLLGASEDPYWHNEEAVAVVRVPATTRTETK
jgi:hypothetical protein